MINKHGTGAFPSPFDVRTFKYEPHGFARAELSPEKGGERWKPEEHYNQRAVGTCTSTAIVQLASKLYGVEFSDDFQYLMQKKYYDVPLYPQLGWGEGSSIFHALRAGKEIGFLPKEYWTFTTEEDKDLSYEKYLAKLRAVPLSEIERLKEIASQYRLRAYAGTKDLERDTIARAINESDAGVLVRFDLGREWYYGRNGKRTSDKEQLEPLRPPKKLLSGHAVVDTNFDGGSFRISNTWGGEWCDGGTAYYLHHQYRPTECWMLWKGEVPPPIDQKLKERLELLGRLKDALQKLVVLLRLQLANKK